MKNVRYFIEYIFLVTMGVFARLVPRKVMLFLGRKAGDFIYYCVPIRKKIIIDHLGRAFPEKSTKEVRTIARKTYHNLVLLAFEHLCFPGLSKEDLLQIVTFENLEVLEKAYSRNKGVVFVGGHFGNWEYMGGAVSSMGYSVTYVVAGISNPYVDTMVNRHRQQTGAQVLSKGVTVRGILKTLRGNGGMALLMDQDAGRSGVFVEYFGRPCSTPKGPALFALKTEAAVVFVAAIRQADGTIRAVFEDIEVDYSQGVTDENIQDLTQLCTAKLESYVRKYPDHWFWMHRRWKTPPEAALPVSEK